MGRRRNGAADQEGERPPGAAVEEGSDALLLRVDRSIHLSDIGLETGELTVQSAPAAARADREDQEQDRYQGQGKKLWSGHQTDLAYAETHHAPQSTDFAWSFETP